MTVRCSVACRACSAGWWDDDERLDPLGDGSLVCPLCGRRLVVTGCVEVTDLAHR